MGKNKIRAAITGIGGYLPKYVLDNEELSQMLETTDEWIMTRIGVKTRHILKGEGKGSSHMAVRAVQDLLEKTGVDPLEIDMVICATVTPDMMFPTNAALVADVVGLKKAFCFDMNAACSGFLFGLQTAAAYIESGHAKKVILVGTDKMSSIIDYTDRAVAPIFGDGSGAVLMEPNSEGYGIQDFIFHTDGSGGAHLYMKAGGSRYPASLETVENREHYVTQDGQTVFKAAVSNMADTTVELMEKNHLKSEDIDFLVPHQANIRIIKATATRAGVPDDKCMVNIDRYGNTTTGTLPLCLMDYESRIKKGDNLIFAAFGGGFSWGALYMKWAYDGATMEK